MLRLYFAMLPLTQLECAIHTYVNLVHISLPL